LTVPVELSTTAVTPEVVDESDHPSEESNDEPNEVKTLYQTLIDITTEWDALQVQLEEVTRALKQKRARVDQRMSFGQFGSLLP